MSEIAQRVIKVVCDYFEKSIEEVKLESDFIEDLNADSLDTVDIMMSIEEEFDIELDDEETAKLSTVKDLVDYLETLVETV